VHQVLLRPAPVPVTLLSVPDFRRPAEAVAARRVGPRPRVLLLNFAAQPADGLLTASRVWTSAARRLPDEHEPGLMR